MFEIETMQLIGFGMPGVPELMIIMVILLLLFGGAKLPSLMRNLGRSVNEFKHGISEKPTDKSLDQKDDGKDAMKMSDRIAENEPEKEPV